MVFQVSYFNVCHEHETRVTTDKTDESLKNSNSNTKSQYSTALYIISICFHKIIHDEMPIRLIYFIKRRKKENYTKEKNVEIKRNSDVSNFLFVSIHRFLSLLLPLFICCMLVCCFVSSLNLIAFSLFFVFALLVSCKFRFYYSPSTDSFKLTIQCELKTFIMTITIS